MSFVCFLSRYDYSDANFDVWISLTSVAVSQPMQRSEAPPSRGTHQIRPNQDTMMAKICMQVCSRLVARIHVP